MSGIKLDRSNRNKVGVVTGTPDTSTKGTIVLNDSGWAYSRPDRDSSWNLVSPFRNLSTTIYPLPTGSQHDLTDSTGTLKALTWSASSCYFGHQSVCYPADGTALKTVLQSTFTGTIVLGPQEYVMPGGKITISYPKEIVGMSKSKSIITLSTDEKSINYIAVASDNVVFKNLSITRAEYTKDCGDLYLILFQNVSYGGIFGCNIGDANLEMDSKATTLIEIDGCTFISVEDCFFTLPVVTPSASAPPSLISVEDSISTVIRNNLGANLCCRWAIDMLDSSASTVDGNIFANLAEEDTSVGISLRGSSSASYIVNNRISNINNFGSLTKAALLFIDDTDDMGVIGFVANVHVENNQFHFTVKPNSEDLAPSEDLITLGMKYSTFIGNKVKADSHGYNDDVDVVIIPQKVVIKMYGDSIVFDSNNILATDCRCALMVESVGTDPYPGMGHRITNNSISKFSIATPGFVVTTGLRNDATGIYLADNETGGTLRPCSGVISGNTIYGGVNSTAIRGCPSNCAAPSWPPEDNETAYNWAIIGNVIRKVADDETFGISVATISYSTIIGNLSNEREVVDVSELGQYSNGTNEYGTSGSTEQGANLDDGSNAYPS